jgi:hypothetical protein
MINESLLKGQFSGGRFVLECSMRDNSGVLSAPKMYLSCCLFAQVNWGSGKDAKMKFISKHLTNKNFKFVFVDKEL